MNAVKSQTSLMGVDYLCFNNLTVGESRMWEK